MHGLTSPLLTRSDGSKYGKSSSGENLWLSARRMSPYRFYQAWIGSPDEDVRKLLLQLTLLPVAEVEAIIDEHRTNPDRRGAQRRLAREITNLVHGPEDAGAAERASEVLFSGADPTTVDQASWDVLEAEIPRYELDQHRLEGGAVPVDLFADLGLCPSRSEARRLLNQGGWQVNGRRLGAEDRLDESDLLAGRYILVRRGKQRYHLLVRL